MQLKEVIAGVKRHKKKLLIVLGVALVYFAYPYFENNYQKNMDLIRKDHVRQIVEVIREYADATGKLPFQDRAVDQPFMVLIGHSQEHEDHFAKDPVLQRNAQWTNSSELESVLSTELKRTVQLPREPQKVPTFAPNVYLYFVAGNQMTVASHLKFPSEQAVEYEWNGMETNFIHSRFPTISIRSRNITAGVPQLYDIVL